MHRTQRLRSAPPFSPGPPVIVARVLCGHRVIRDNGDLGGGAKGARVTRAGWSLNQRLVRSVWPIVYGAVALILAVLSSIGVLSEKQTVFVLLGAVGFIAIQLGISEREPPEEEIRLDVVNSYVEALEELYSYVKRAKTRVYDLTWGSSVLKRAPTEVEMDVRQENRESILNVCQHRAKRDFRYQEIMSFPFSDAEPLGERIDLARQMLASAPANYFLRYYDFDPDFGPPLLQFTVIDHDLVAFLYGNDPTRGLFVHSNAINSFFSKFFEEIWADAEVLKDGTNCHTERLERVAQRGEERDRAIAPNAVKKVPSSSQRRGKATAARRVVRASPPEPGRAAPEKQPRAHKRSGTG